MLFEQDQLEFKACTSFDEVFDAIIRLCRHPFVVLECMPALSRHIFCLATPVISQPKTVYAFDLEAMPSDTHTRKAVIALLVRKDIIKVVWDGQHFYQQLQSSLNVAVSPVLDLQLLDVLERVDAENQGSRPRDSCSTTLTSRLLHRINENLTRKSKTVVPLEVCIAQYAPDAPTRTFQDLSERFQRPEILLLLKMGSKVEDIAYLMRAFVSSGLLPDVASAEFTDIVTELHFLLERSRRFVTLSRLEDESVAFDAHLFPMLAAAKSSYKPYLNSTIPINAPSLPPLPPIPSTSATHVTSTSAPTGRVTYTKDGVSELVEYEFCDTSESILSAVNAVSQHRFVLLDCEAKCLGSLAGVLSIISLGIPFQPHEALSQRIFLIDVLALSEISDPRPREAIAQLLTSSATKVVWDGRMDAVELREYFGVTLGPVLDLQIAEVLGRSYVGAESEKERRNRIGRRLGPKILKRKAATQALFANLHVVLAMGKVPTAYKISTPISKQRHVKKELFGDAGCVLERPAPRKLLNYSAGDIRIMAHIFAHFTATDIVPVNTPHFKRLIELSDRYVSRNGLSGRAEPGPLFAGYLLLTDSLTESLAGAAICKACGNLLTPACFERKGKLRREQCRACVVTALSSRTPKEVARSLRETWV